MSGPKATWQSTKLTSSQRQELTSVLGADISDKKVDQIGSILLDTANNQKLIDETYLSLPKTETKTETTLLLNNFKAITRNLEKLPKLTKNHLDTCYWVANGHQKKHITETNVDSFLDKLLEMQKAVNQMHDHPLPTNNRTDHYTDSLHSIATSFSNLFPQYKISYTKASRFYRLVQYWHIHILDSGVKDPKAQIRRLQKIIHDT